MSIYVLRNYNDGSGFEYVATIKNGADSAYIVVRNNFILRSTPGIKFIDNGLILIKNERNLDYLRLVLLLNNEKLEFI